MANIKNILTKSKNKKLLADNPTIRSVVELIVDELKDELVTTITAELELAGGKDGLPGSQGERGESGEQGIEGKPGENGTDGQNGALGERGELGMPGEDGVDGNPGKNGKDGKNGSPDKPQAIVDKLNTLTGKVEPSVIKGLEKMILQLGRSIQEVKRIKSKGGGGGGMGNVLHEAFSLTGATSSVTLSSDVATSGFAIWVYFNGQAVSRNDSAGYSISGNVITLNFTPDNGTFLDVIYIRSG